MAIKNSIFGSKMEKGHFINLTRKWGKQFNIYHNVPFLNIFSCRDEELIDLDNWLETYKVSVDEYELLKKLSVDFVLCNKADKPFICIEFDGLLKGFNTGRKYVPRGKPSFPLARKETIELKLRVAHSSGMPFFVMSSAHFKEISNIAKSSVLDAIIGEVLSNEKKRKRFSEFSPDELGYTSEEFSNLPDSQQREMIEDWALGVEVESDYSENPIFPIASKLSKEVGLISYTIEFPNSVLEDDQAYSIVRCLVNSTLGIGKGEFRFPNFNSPGAFFGTHLAQELAKILALLDIKSRPKE